MPNLFRTTQVVIAVTVFCGCTPTRQVDEFGEVVGCYYTEDGRHVLEITQRGSVRDSSGDTISVVKLSVLSNSSVLEFSPGIVVSDDLLVSTKPDIGTKHLVMFMGDQVIIGLAPGASPESAMALFKRQQICA